MTCAKSFVIILWNTLLFNKEYRSMLLKSCVKSYIDINYWKKIFTDKYSIITTLVMVCTLIFCSIYNFSFIKSAFLLFVVAIFLLIYATYNLYKHIAPHCMVLCNCVGANNFKRSIKLLIICTLDKNFTPTDTTDIEIIKKLEELD